MNENPMPGDSAPTRGDTNLVLRAMRLAERAHRSNNHFRKAPAGEDRPAYFLHLAEVAWMLHETGMSDPVVAAGFLHDMIEDCGYTREQLATEIEDTAVAELVSWVLEPEKDQSWEVRNRVYLERIKTASNEVLALSCADKTSNLRDMLNLLDKGHDLCAFMSRGMDQQINKFTQLDRVFQGRVPTSLYRRFSDAFARLQGYAKTA